MNNGHGDSGARSSVSPKAHKNRISPPIACPNGASFLPPPSNPPDCRTRAAHAATKVLLSCHLPPVASLPSCAPSFSLSSPRLPHKGSAHCFQSPFLPLHASTASHPSFLPPEPRALIDCRTRAACTFGEAVAARDAAACAGQQKRPAGSTAGQGAH